MKNYIPYKKWVGKKNHSDHRYKSINASKDAVIIDVREGTSGTSADVHRFRLRIDSVSSWEKFVVKFYEIGIFLQIYC